MTAGHSFAISPHAICARCSFIPALQTEGAGNAGRPMRPRSRVQDVLESAHEHTGHTGITRHSPRNGFNGYFVISPVLRAFWPPSPALLLADLTPASGCQDHTTSHVRGKSPFVIGASASTASRPAAVTIATRPSVGRDGCEYRGDLHF